MFLIPPPAYDGGSSVTQSDTTADPAGPFAALQATAGTGGTAKVTTSRGTTLTVYLPLGVIVPIACTQVWSTGTTASMNIIGLHSVQWKGNGT